MTAHFLRDDDLSPDEQADVLALAARLKAGEEHPSPFGARKAVALVFDKPTLRTQVSFMAGVAELGGQPMVVDGTLARIGVRESVADTARALGRQCAAVVWRTYGQDRLEEMARSAGVPVVNALTDRFHPCQLLADLQTMAEHRGPLAGRTVAFLGDTASNMSHSYLLVGATAGMHVRVGGPEAFPPDADVLERARAIAADTGGSAAHVTDPLVAVEGADAVVTDTWVSMGKEAEADQRSAPFVPFRLDAALLARARPDALVLHCLPAYRGREVTADVLDGPQSVVWDEAENRLHAQKAVLCWLLGRPPARSS